MKPEIFLDEMNERGDLRWLQRLRVNPLEHVQHIFGSQKRQMMPALQPDINPVRNSESLAQRSQLRSRSQSQRHEMLDDLRVEGVSSNAHAGVAHDVAGDSPVST